MLSKERLYAQAQSPFDMEKNKVVIVYTASLKRGLDKSSTSPPPPKNISSNRGLYFKKHRHIKMSVTVNIYMVAHKDFKHFLTSFTATTLF